MRRLQRNRWPNSSYLVSGSSTAMEILSQQIPCLAFKWRCTGVNSGQISVSTMEIDRRTCCRCDYICNGRSLHSDPRFHPARRNKLKDGVPHLVNIMRAKPELASSLEVVDGEGGRSWTMSCKLKSLPAPFAKVAGCVE